ncbi:acetylgalactosaminyl-O-glycosyl-glycoprotein beta-1,3-N-acetylglucosaminyltransferase-like [Sycon ciliatum]|uniref:acetylgalactosaminyl-O-glycosyl-glycoprotein beta-1,3-N-acetylglucosaminyltransferase-like n=1 Tax=Sycon ciliatum TaxID=27933 RepID=UPI0020ACE111|eukprot:scpid64038/ scgid13778/ UDP-GlcNAc:betaGal beta-1,3-N-acetylglucosaminyltransferase 6; Core 3 synthase
MPHRSTTTCLLLIVLVITTFIALVVVLSPPDERAPTGRDVADEVSMPLTEPRTVEALRKMVHSLQSISQGNKGHGVSSDDKPVTVIKRLNHLLPMYFKRAQRSSSLKEDKSNLIRLLLLTKSAPGNFDKRLQTRLTWLSLAIQSSNCRCTTNTGDRCTRYSRLCQYRHIVWYHRFLIGMDNEDTDLMDTVLKDGNEHLDVLWYPEEDHYRRLTWKVHWAMQWVVNNLRIDYLMFVDDDSFMHLPHLATYLATAPRTHLYGGRVPYNDAVVVRDKKSKWYVKEKAFPGQHYPRYVWGAGMILSSDVMHMVVERSHMHETWFGVDDAFIGIILNRSGLSPTNIKSIYPAMSVFHGCTPGTEGQPPILISSIDEWHRHTMMEYAMGSLSLCSLMVWPVWWRISSFVQSYAFILILAILALIFCRPLVQRRYLFRLIVYV